MSRYTTNSHYPLIPSSNEFMIEQRVVSIHSEDRDITKFPNSSSFEIELPDDYTNVSTVKLGTYTFPANYNTFSLVQGNILFIFKFDVIYNPLNYGYSDPILEAMYNVLEFNINNEYPVLITEGFYTPIQIALELMNRMNETINTFILKYINPLYLEDYKNSSYYGYNQFVVIYNEVSQTLWFGNKSSGFTIKNTSEYYETTRLGIQTYMQCYNGYETDGFTNWGLPPYLGFSRCDTPSIKNDVSGNFPRFYYTNTILKSNGIAPPYNLPPPPPPGPPPAPNGDYDYGYWLVPDSGYIGLGFVNYLQAPFKINILGHSYIYMEIEGLNNIDETRPFQLNSFTEHTNQTNGTHNAAFAKIGVTSTPISQWYDNNTEAIKIFNPPAERIRKVKIKMRYHNGSLVNFSTFNYSFNLIFSILRPQQLRSYMNFDPTANSTSGVSNVIAKR